MVLANLVPGLRDLRAPLAAGYLWLAVGWLVFGDRLRSSAVHGHGLVHSVYELHGAVSLFGVGVAVTFTAYLVGSVAEAFGAVLGTTARAGFERGRRFAAVEGKVIDEQIRAARLTFEQNSMKLMRAYLNALERLLSPRGNIEMPTPRAFEVLGRTLGRYAYILFLVIVLPFLLTVLLIRGVTGALLALDSLRKARARTTAALRVVVRDAIHDTAGANRLDALEVIGRELQLPQGERQDESIVIAVAVETMRSELDLVAMRLVGKEDQLFAMFDRMRAEAEFRFAVVPSLAALVGVVAVKEHSAIWLIALITVAGLLWQGVTKRAESRDLIADSLRLGRVHSPFIERVKSLLLTSRFG